MANLTKIVDGKRVDVADDEDTAIRAGWIAAAAVSQNPRDYTLSPKQWRHMVRKAGLWDHIDTVKAYLKANDLSAWADLMETLEGNPFKFDATLAQVASFAPMLAGVTLPDEAALTPLWLEAAAR